MFVDEPTSGLSSRDSENVIDLLKELSLKGKLVFVVIHQPSSDIYKMFDKMFIMDTGGFPIFYGHPVEAVTYFKKATNQVDSERGQCAVCGNVNPEQIFNIIEANVVDEYGQFTNKRKVNPQQWHDQYNEKFKLYKFEDVKEAPPKALNIPSKLQQAYIFVTRDMLAKISNKQYLLINLLEAPLLALILAFIIRYKSSPNSEEYIFRFNENIPAYIMMSIVVALFMGLSVSAEEIIRDRKILKRESFLNLSWSSYLSSKLTILFLLSAIQTLSFVIVGNLILEIHSMTISFWLVLFTVSCFANVLGLNVSSAFNSAVTVYILIPLLLIPQMILSGLMFPFDKLNNLISTKGEVPVLADFMASRWAYEAMVVNQFITNDFEAPFYNLEQEEKTSDFKATYLVPKLEEKIQFVYSNIDTEDDSVSNILNQNLKLLVHEINKDPFKEGLEKINISEVLLASNLKPETEKTFRDYLKAMESHYRKRFNTAVLNKEKMIYFFENNEEYDYDYNELKNHYHNESLYDLVRNLTVKDRIIEFDGRLIQQLDPIFTLPEPPSGPLDYRTHFLAPQKHLFNTYFQTFSFNLLVIWFMTALLFVMLYFELFSKILNRLGKVKLFGKKS
jgi:recombinational DNA repair protein RecR